VFPRQALFRSGQDLAAPFVRHDPAIVQQVAADSGETHVSGPDQPAMGIEPTSEAWDSLRL